MILTAILSLLSLCAWIAILALEDFTFAGNGVRGAVRTEHELLWAARRPNANGDGRRECRTDFTFVAAYSLPSRATIAGEVATSPISPAPIHEAAQ